MNEISENEKLKRQLEETNCRMLELKRAFESLQKENEESCNKLQNLKTVIATLEKSIEWHKGQVDAYQYCMNCRR